MRRPAQRRRLGRLIPLALLGAWGVGHIVPGTALMAAPVARAQRGAVRGQEAIDSPEAKRPRLFPPEDLGLLEAPDRDDWNKPHVIMDALGIADGASVADLGAGGGWFTVRLARRVGPNGVVYAEDIQREMIEAISRRVQHEGIDNVRPVLGTPTDPRLPPGLDAVLIVDAYHEMDDPGRPDVIRLLLNNVSRALKPQGRLGVVDFLAGDGGPGPVATERVDPDRVVRAAESAGLRLLFKEELPPFQYLLVFVRGAAREPGR